MKDAWKLLGWALLFFGVVPLCGQMMRERVAEELERVQTLMEEDKKDDALLLINRLADFSLSDYERAAVMQNKGYVHLNRDELAEAIPCFEEAVAGKLLNEELNLNMTYMLSQLYAFQERWADCLRSLEEWLPSQEHPARAAYQVGAQAAAALNQYDRAIDYAKKAIDAEPNPPESLFRLWMALNFQKGDLREAGRVVAITLVHFPDRPDLWKNLGQIRLALQEDQEAAAAFWIAYQKGYLKTGDEWINLSRLLLFTDQPHKAAQVLEKGLADGLVPGTGENWELLSNAWFAAREPQKSLVALDRAAEISPKPELDLRAGQLHLDLEEWAEAARRLEAALAKSEGKENMIVYQLLGYAYYGLGDFDRAKEVFGRLLGNDRLRESAEMWMVHLDEEIARVKELEALRAGGT